MGIVRMIPATVRGAGKKKDNETADLRVAAYCRVSTDTDEQETSYDAQIDHYTDYISKHPGWVLAGIYADDGISGTSTKKRDEFNRMIEDCMNGKVDMIVTKSISRFARNTLDCLRFIRQLKEKGVAVFFEKEAINTLDAKGEVLLTIMASLAQQESQSLSQNVKLGLQYRYQQGKVQVNHNRFLGYTKDENGNLIIDPVEAEVVKRIYREYLEGKSYYEIGKGLTADGIKTAAGNEYWLASTLRKILMNEKYMGDALLQKTVTTDFLSKKRAVNKGIAPQYYVEGSHEAIIPRTIFLQVQEEIARRANLRTGTGSRRVYSGKYALSSIVYCAHCGDIFQRTQWYIHNENIPVWRCGSKLSRKKIKTECSSRTIYERDLQAAVLKAINELVAQKDEFIPQFKTVLEKTLCSGNAGKIAELDDRLQALEKELLEKANARKDYDVELEQIDALRDEKQRLMLEDAENSDSKRRLAEIEAFLDEQETEITEYDENLVRKLLERVTVYNDYLTVTFKSGMEIDVGI